MKNVRDAGFSRKRGGNAGSGSPLPDPHLWVHVPERVLSKGDCVKSWYSEVMIAQLQAGPMKC